MNKHNLIDKFLHDQDDYIKFLVSLTQRIIANDEGTCFAELKKEDGCFLYTLTWLKDGRFIADYVKPFRATKENIDIFNNGCKIMAQWLEIYIDTDDINAVAEDTLAFGVLTEIKP